MMLYTTLQTRHNVSISACQTVHDFILGCSTELAQHREDGGHIGTWVSKLRSKSLAKQPMVKTTVFVKDGREERYQGDYNKVPLMVLNMAVTRTVSYTTAKEIYEMVKFLHKKEVEERPHAWVWVRPELN